MPAVAINPTRKSPQFAHNRLFQEPFTNPNHHLLAPPLSHHHHHHHQMASSDHQLKRPLPVNGHNGHIKMPESPLGHSMHSQSSSSSSSIPPSPASTSAGPSSADPQASAHLIEEYLQTQISRWRSNNLEMTDLIAELLTVMPSEDQMQFMTGIMEVIYKKRNNPEEEKQMRKYFLGGATGS